MKNLFSILLFISTFISANLFTQTIYNSGFIITVQEDTIDGYILNNIDSEMAYKINFKEDSLNSRSETYTTSDLLGFSFDNGRTFDRFSINESDGFSKDSLYVFAKSVLKGKIDYWVWRHPQKKSDIFLVNNSTNKTVHLTKPQKDIKSGKDGHTYIKKDLKHMGLLIYIKSDSVNFKSSNKKIKYSEKILQEDIYKYNNKFKKNYPISKYTEKVEYNYDLMIGIPIRFQHDGVFYRAGIYTNKIYVEKSKNKSFISGITYFHWIDNKEWDYSFELGMLNYKWQLLSIIPIGVKFQGNAKYIRTYGYVGVGLAILMHSDYKIVDFENTGSKTHFFLFPTINAGAGVKIKVGSKYILAELTPSVTGIFINLGFSF